jgi:ComF family protein
MNRVQEMVNGLLHLLYPELCEHCRHPLVEGEQILCLGCTDELPETNYHHRADNETALRFAGRFPFEHATSLAWFTDDGILQELLHGLKYRQRKDIGRYLGRRFAQRLQGEQWITGVQAIVPVPLHTKKERQRGYNQSAIIAGAMGAVLGLPVWENAVMRTRHTESQTKKTRSERLANMEGAFAAGTAPNLAGSHVLLLDDVLTTGATLEACARALKRVEGLKISLATIGIAQ